jgi:TolA-binding protein
MAPPLTPDFSAFATARLVRDGLADGSINPRNPAWRPHLALLLSDPAYALEADTLFAAILSGCAGYDDRARIATAEAWAGGFEGGRFASTIAYCAARQEFTSGNYAAAESRCKRIIAEHPEATDRAMLLMAFAQAQSGDHKRALLTLKGFRKLHPESPAVPEARFMEAWIALQESRNDDAVAILRDIVTETPHAPAAAKATKMLADLEGVK